MDLRDKLRKVASLVVELPEEAPAPEPDETRGAPPGTGTTQPDGGSAETDDLDRRLAAMRANINALQSGGTVTGAPPAPGSTKTVEQIARDTDGPNLDAVTAPAATPAAPILRPDGTVDFAALYGQSNLPGAPFTAEQMLDMLASLPADLPLGTKRQTVKVTLGAMGKAIGATAETIVADASRKLAALAAYSETVSKQTAEFVAAGEFEIAALEKQIAEKRQEIEFTKQKLAQLQSRCHAEADRLDDVLEFFSLDVPPSRYAPGAK